MLVLKKKFKVDPIDSVRGRVFTWDDDEDAPISERTVCRVAMHSNERFEAEMRALFRRLDEEWREKCDEIEQEGFRKRKALTKAQQKKRDEQKESWRLERINEEAPAIYSRCVWLGADRLALDLDDNDSPIMLEVGPTMFSPEIMADEELFWAAVEETAPLREEILRDRRFKEFYDEIHATCYEQQNFHVEQVEADRKNSLKSSDGASSGDNASNS